MRLLLGRRARSFLGQGSCMSAGPGMLECYFCRHVLGSAVALRVELRLGRLQGFVPCASRLGDFRGWPALPSTATVFSLFAYFSSGFLEGLFALGQSLSTVVQQLVSCVGAAAC